MSSPCVAVCSLQGIGRRFANLVLKKADIDMSKRAGELTEEEVDRVVTIMQNPRQYKIPDWFLNRQKDRKDGKYGQVSGLMTVGCVNRVLWMRVDSFLSGFVAVMWRWAGMCTHLVHVSSAFEVMRCGLCAASPTPHRCGAVAC